MEHNDILHTEWSSKKGEFPSKRLKRVTYMCTMAASVGI